MPLLDRPSSLQMVVRAEFSQAAFASLVQQYGYDVRWSKFIRCPNIDPKQPDHHRIGCTLCDRVGRVYYDPLVTRMIASSFATATQWNPESQYDRGTVYFTTLPDARVSFRDKIEMLSAEVRYSEVVLLTATSSYALRFNPTSIESVLTSNGTLVDPASISLNGDGTITFATPPGTPSVSIAYNHHPVYIVTDLMHVVRDSRTTVGGQDTPTAFNRQVAAQLQFILDDPAGTERSNG